MTLIYGSTLHRDCGCTEVHCILQPFSLVIILNKVKCDG